MTIDVVNVGICKIRLKWEVVGYPAVESNTLEWNSIISKLLGTREKVGNNRAYSYPIKVLHRQKSMGGFKFKISAVWDNGTLLYKTIKNILNHSYAWSVAKPLQILKLQYTYICVCNIIKHTYVTVILNGMHRIIFAKKLGLVDVSQGIAMTFQRHMPLKTLCFPKMLYNFVHAFENDCNVDITKTTNTSTALLPTISH